MAFIYDLTDTWNASGTTFNAIKMNVTDTASAAASKLLTLQVGGAERFGIDKAGNVLIGNGGDLQISSATGGNNSTFYNDAQDLYITTNGTARMYINSSGDVGVGNTSPGTKLDVTGNIRLSAPIPVIEWNSGGAQVYAPAGNTLAIATGGGIGSPVERLRVDSSGNVGIGTSSPGAKLDVNGDAAFGAIITTGTGVSTGDARLELGGNRSSEGASYVDLHSHAGADYSFRMLRSSGANGDTQLINFGSGAMWFGTNNTERMRIDSSGNVGIGTSSTANISGFTTLSINGSSGSWSEYRQGESFVFRVGSDSSTGGFLYHQGAHPIRFLTSNSERMRVTSDGRLLLGVSSAFDNVSFLGAQFQGGLATRLPGTGATSQLSFFNDNGRVGFIFTDGTSTGYSTSSDARLKHNIVDAPDAADLIDAIKVRSFKWNADNSEQRYGMVAQELLEVAPEAVSGDPEGEEMLGVDYSKLVPMLVKEVQSLRARVAQLEGN